MALFLSQNNVAAEVALNHFPPTSGVTPPLSALPCGLSEVVRYVAQECCVSLGWATAAVLASIGISLQGTVKVRLGETCDCPVLPAFLLMGERGSGKDRTLRLVLRAIRQWENQKGTSILSARRSYVQQMRKTFEHGGFSALADGELDSLSELFSHPDHRGVVSRVMRKFDLALAEIYFRGRVHAPWLPSSGQGAKGQGRRYAARLALDAL